MRKYLTNRRFIQRWRWKAFAHPKTRSPSQDLLRPTPIVVRCGEKDGFNLFKKKQAFQNALAILFTKTEVRFS